MSRILKKIYSISPHLEILFRKIYWKNVKYFYKFRLAQSFSPKDKSEVDFSKILEWLQNNGVKKGTLLLVHSSFDALEGTKMKPREINNELINLIGTHGTLAMPVIRKFKGTPKVFDILKTDMENIRCIYNVHKTVIWTGFLSFNLMHRENAVISRFPLNPLAAIGKLAVPMMAKNLEGKILLPHGINSSWKFCADNNAIVVGLGINLIHSLTIMHIIEDCMYPSWPVEDWYRKRLFTIIDKYFETDVEVYERKPKWGMLYIAENKLRRDLLRNNILKTTTINSVLIELINSQQLYRFLQEKNSLKRAYPYYIPTKYLK